jgi:hypothetical protein
MAAAAGRTAVESSSLARLACFCAYAASCAALHALLQQHYVTTCRSSWLSLFALDPGPYCALVRKSLTVIQWSPLVASGLWLPQLQAAGA